jgi:hypothetical protein
LLVVVVARDNGGDLDPDSRPFVDFQGIGFLPRWRNDLAVKLFENP